MLYLTQRIETPAAVTATLTLPLMSASKAGRR